MRKSIFATALTAGIILGSLAQANNGKMYLTRAKHQKVHGIRLGMQPSAHLAYYGGPVLSNPKVVPVMWGSKVDPNIQSKMSDFYGTLLNNPYMDWLKEYDTNITAQDGASGTNQTIGRGTVGTQTVITPINATFTLDDTAVQAEIAAQLAKGGLPASDNNTLYMISFPAGYNVTLTQGGSVYTSCVDFCAYHNSFADAHGNQIFYGVMPDFSGACGNACGTNDPFGNYTSAASHEVIEATTDSNVSQMGTSGAARPLAWYDSAAGEIGDICAYQGFDGTVTSSSTGNTYVVQGQWSNAQNACVVKPAGVL